VDNLRFDGPGRYSVITRDGWASEVSELFEAVEVRSEFSEGRNFKVFTIDVKDQSELMSFLNSLYGWRHTIIKVVHEPGEKVSDPTV
jgi:hypothetical protein